MAEKTDYAHGGDQIKLKEIAETIYGGYAEMLAFHGWERTSGPIMNDVSRGVKNRYGGIRDLEALYDRGSLNGSPLLSTPSVWITSFWGWQPENWGGVGFSNEGRPDKIAAVTSNPFIMVVYITETTPEKEYKHLAGKVVGYYELSHQRVMKEEIVSPHVYNRADPAKWRHSFKALKAWTILEDFMPNIREFYPEIHNEGLAQSVSTWAAELPRENVEKLLKLPCRMVDVYPQYGAPRVHPVEIPSNGKGYVSGGAQRRSGYEVDEPVDTAKELYLLKLSGDASSFLGKNVEGKAIYKVGLSMSPKSRQVALNKSFPRLMGKKNTAFRWELFKTSTGSGYKKFPNFNTAEAAERKIKKFLGMECDTSEHLGGEMYAAEPDVMKKIWTSVHGK